MIRFEHVTKRFRDLTAVNELNMEVAAGELFGFIGPNGAGKTTTIKLLVSLLQPTKGDIYINDLKIKDYPEETKRMTGYIPESPYLYDRLSGREFLKFVGGLYNMDSNELNKKIDWLFDLFEITTWGDKKAMEYSHGMRQKIVMSSALIHSPEIILIDEPMVGLDPKSQKLVKDVLTKLVQRGTTVFLSTHTLAIAEEICTKIGIINEGQLMKLGSLDELKSGAQMEGQSLEELFLSLTGGVKEANLYEADDQQTVK